jgi:CPA2 family monovalent cation:H+ antiporter-2
MAGTAAIDPSSTGLSDALTILGAAGIVIPAFARLRISPVIGFILVGIIAGPHILGFYAATYPWLSAVSISDPHGIEPFAEFGIILLLFSAGLHLSLRRLKVMARPVFGFGSVELLGCACLIGIVAYLTGSSLPTSVALGVALGLSSTALVLPIAGVDSPVGRTAFAMLLFEDLALVPLIFLIELIGGHGEAGGLLRTALLGVGLVAVMLIVGRFVLPMLFAQAARTKNPELFLAISLLTVILASLATNAVGLSPILGALVAGILIAETDYDTEVGTIVAPLAGLALGVFLITIGMRIDIPALLTSWPLILGATAAVLVIKAAITAVLLAMSGVRKAVAIETGVLMASPSETSLIVLTAAATAGLLSPGQASFWTTVTAIGLTVTPLLAAAGRLIGRSAEASGGSAADAPAMAGRTVIIGFGRVGRMVATMLNEHGRAYVGVDSDIDVIRSAHHEGFEALFGDIARPELEERLHLDQASALVLTMDDPVQVARITRRVRARAPDLPIIARARDTNHAARLYEAGVTDAVPEALEASLQLAEAVLVDLGVAMGKVIASIHEKRDAMRSEIKSAANLTEKPTLGRRRLRDLQPSPNGSKRSTPAT